MSVSYHRSLLCAAVAFAAGLMMITASSASAQTADEVIAKNIKAQGGREALTGLKCIERVGDVNMDGSFGQMEGVVEEVCVPFKKARRSMDLMVFFLDEGWNGDVAWRDDMMGLRKLEGPESNQIKQLADLNPFLSSSTKDAKVEKLDDETVDDVEYYVIQMAPADQPAVKIFIDKKSDQIGRVTLTQNNPQFGEIDISVEISGYEKFGPVTLATKEKVTLGDLFEIQTTYTDTKIDGQVDDAIFEMPSDEPKEEKKDKPKDEAK